MYRVDEVVKKPKKKDTTTRLGRAWAKFSDFMAKAMEYVFFRISDVSWTILVITAEYVLIDVLCNEIYGYDLYDVLPESAPVRWLAMMAYTLRVVVSFMVGGVVEMLKIMFSWMGG